MAFISREHTIKPKSPLFCGILANTYLSTVPGLSGTGPSPTGSLLVPVLDSELIVKGEITSSDATPNTASGCPTPATITRSMVDLTKVPCIFVNAGLNHRPTVPCLDVNGEPGRDPRTEDAVPHAKELFRWGQWAGTFFSPVHDMLVLGECVPGGTTTALCVLRALGYDARVSSASVRNPTSLKEEIAEKCLTRVQEQGWDDALDLIRLTGDPMMAVAAGIVSSFNGSVFLAGGTQMMAVAALIKDLGYRIPEVVTTSYVRDDPAANCDMLAMEIGAPVTYIDPGFGEIGHSGLVRYCIGEVKEGMGCGGSMFLAHQMGYTPEKIRSEILRVVRSFCP